MYLILRMFQYFTERLNKNIKKVMFWSAKDRDKDRGERYFQDKYIMPIIEHSWTSIVVRGACHDERPSSRGSLLSLSLSFSLPLSLSLALLSLSLLSLSSSSLSLSHSFSPLFLSHSLASLSLSLSTSLASHSHGSLSLSHLSSLSLSSIFSNTRKIQRIEMICDVQWGIELTA